MPDEAPPAPISGLRTELAEAQLTLARVRSQHARMRRALIDVLNAKAVLRSSDNGMAPWFLAAQQALVTSKQLEEAD